MYEIPHPASTKITLNRATRLLGERLGGGGFGAVHHGLGQDGSSVVLKFVRASTAAIRELNLAEFETALHVLPVLDTGEYEGDCVLVLPLADLSLRDRLGQADFIADADAKLFALMEVASGLIEIETLVHRDLKPENVLLHDGHWKLTDFGTSRHVDAATATSTLKHVGTAQYWAPEQWRLEHATAACDVYAFGVLATEVLSGHLPFDGTTPEDLRKQHLFEVPDLHGVPTELHTLIADCLQKQPGVRPTATRVKDRLKGMRTVTPQIRGGALARGNRLANDKKTARQVEGERCDEERLRRQELFDVSEHKWNTIISALLDAIKTVASEAELNYTESLEKSGNPICGGMRATLLSGALDLIAPCFVSTATDLPFDVIGFSSVEVTSNNQGRSHSLWFCDFETPGTHLWWEISFMSSPLVPQEHPNEPYSLDATTMEARDAFSSAMASTQRARPMTEIDPDNPGEFVERWLNFFGLAATNELERPRQLPETS